MRVWLSAFPLLKIYVIIFLYMIGNIEINLQLALSLLADGIFLVFASCGDFNHIVFLYIVFALLILFQLLLQQDYSYLHIGCIIWTGFYEVVIFLFLLNSIIKIE